MVGRSPYCGYYSTAFGLELNKRETKNWALLFISCCGLTVDAACGQQPWVLPHDFPNMMDCTLAPWTKLTLPSLSCHLGYFVRAMRQAWYKVSMRQVTITQSINKKPSYKVSMAQVTIIKSNNDTSNYQNANEISNYQTKHQWDKWLSQKASVSMRQVMITQGINETSN